MDLSDVVQIISLFLLLGMSAFFSSAETAFTTANKIKIRSLAEQGDKRAKKVLKIIDNPGKMLSAILIGNNIVNISASSVATIFATEKLGSAGAGIATGILTLFILIFGEITPKNLATSSAESISLKYSGAITLIVKLFTPVIFIVNNLAYGFMKLLHLNPGKSRAAMTEFELRTIVDVSHEEGVIESEERKIINNIFDFGDSQAKDIMIPRIDMTFADVNSSYQEIIEIYREVQFTRLPIYEGTTDNVVGIINVKDLLLYDQPDTFHVRDIIRKPSFTYEFKNTSELLIEMRENSINFTIVLDEYGATAGLITLEDLLEEIVGEIRDEYDEDEINSIQKINDFEYLIEGSKKLDDLNDALGLELDSEDYDSVGGLIIEHLDRLPSEEEFIELDGMRFVVEKMDKNRVELVRLYLPEETPDI